MQVTFIMTMTMTIEVMVMKMKVDEDSNSVGACVQLRVTIRNCRRTLSHLLVP